ncbi:MAG: hypothetical protein LBU27_05690 [Candidatus Peribacteria bacterium]|jgi:hypothetical protein|nr:hypothetical protein [Candidatus Peribacteria bacterium]
MKPLKEKFNRIKEEMKNPASRKRIQQYLLRKDNRPWLIAAGAGFIIPGPFGLGVVAVFAIAKWKELFPDSETKDD